MAKTQSAVYTGKRAVPQPYDATLAQVTVDFDFPTAAPAAGDLFELIKIPAGIELIDYDITWPQIDTNASPTFAGSLGSENAGFTDLGVVYESGMTPGRNAGGTIVRAGLAAASQASKTVDRAIAFKVTAAAATWAGAGLTGRIVFHLRG